jgi:chromosome partitioning protein
VGFTYSLAHLLLGQVELRDCIVHARDNLDFIASDRSLFEAEGQLWRKSDKVKPEHVLADRMNGLTGYDYVIVDFSPSGSLVNEAGLLYVRELIVPVSMDYLALVGTRQVMSTLRTKIIKWKSESRIRLYLVVPTFYYHRLVKDRYIIELLRRHFGNKVTQPIRASVKLSETPSHKSSIYEYEPRSFGAIDYSRLVERVASDG